MPAPKIDKLKLHQILSGGKSQRQAAQVFGVTEGAISKVAKRLNIDVVRTVSLECAHKVVEKNLNTLDQLQKINAYANELLDLLMRWNRGDEEALQILESQVRKVKVRGRGRNHGIPVQGPPGTSLEGHGRNPGTAWSPA